MDPFWEPINNLRDIKDVHKQKRGKGFGLIRRRCSESTGGKKIDFNQNKFPFINNFTKENSERFVLIEILCYFNWFDLKSPNNKPDAFS
jgi:hypothetical protein